MARKPPIRSIETLNTSLWTEAHRIEKLKEKAEGISLKIEDLDHTPDQQSALSILRHVQSELWNIEAKLEDLAWKLNEAVDALE